MILEPLKYFLIYSAVLVLSICCKQKESKATVYLIPEGYKGEVVVVYDHPNGKDAIFEDGKRLFVINDKGVLKTKSKVSYGLVRDTYYYVAENKKRTEIRSYQADSFQGGMCVYNGITSQIKKNATSYKVSGFMVCPKDSIHDYDDFSFSEIQKNL